MKRLLLLLPFLAATCLASPAAEQDIDLETRTGAIKGTLTTPPGTGKAPVVLLIAGSGPTDRDGNTPLASGRNDNLRMIAVALSEIGVASVRYDKRGIAASSGAARFESDLLFDDYVHDAASWVEKLSEDSRFSGVAVLGHSEGSLIGMLAAQMGGARAFISVSGPADKAPAVLRRQLQGRLPPDLSQRNEEILRSLEGGSPFGDVPPPLMALYRPSVQPYLISWFRHSPAQEIAKLRVPCLLVQGGTDVQVSVDDARALHAANPRCELSVVDGMNHVLKRVPPDPQKQIASYGDPSLPLDPDFVKALARFLSSERVRSVFSEQR